MHNKILKIKCEKKAHILSNSITRRFMKRLINPFTKKKSYKYLITYYHTYNKDQTWKSIYTIKHE